MAERLLLQPPEIIDVDGPVVFLAGPIQDSRDWQTEAASIIHDLDPAIVVASPRKDYLDGGFVYEHQVDWETHYLRLAAKVGVVAFWLAAQEQQTKNTALGNFPRAFAQTTRFELGEWKLRHERDDTKLTLGFEEGFGNVRYIRRRFEQDCPDVKIAEDLAQMCQNAVDLAHHTEETAA